MTINLINNNNIDPHNGELIMKLLNEASLHTLAGDNVDGETVIVGLINDPDIEDAYSITTHQANGHVRVNYYNKYGSNTGETFEGRWDR